MFARLAPPQSTCCLYLLPWLARAHCHADRGSYHPEHVTFRRSPGFDAFWSFLESALRSDSRGGKPIAAGEWSSGLGGPTAGGRDAIRPDAVTSTRLESLRREWNVRAYTPLSDVTSSQPWSSPVGWGGPMDLKKQYARSSSWDLGKGSPTVRYFGAFRGGV